MPPLETPRGMEEERKKFTGEEIIEELKDILYGAPDKVNFKFKKNSNLVEVYIGESLAYVINRNLYKKITEEQKQEDSGAGYNINEYPRKDF